MKVFHLSEIFCWGKRRTTLTFSQNRHLGLTSWPQLRPQDSPTCQSTTVEILRDASMKLFQSFIEDLSNDQYSWTTFAISRGQTASMSLLIGKSTNTFVFYLLPASLLKMWWATFDSHKFNFHKELTKQRAKKSSNQELKMKLSATALASLALIGDVAATKDAPTSVSLHL